MKFLSRESPGGALIGAACLLFCTLPALAQTRSGSPPPRDRAVLELAHNRGEIKSLGIPAGGNSGSAVFHAVLRSGQQAVFTSLGGAAQAVARGGEVIEVNGVSVRLVSFSAYPSMNQGGVVAFGASFNPPGSAVFLRDGVFGKFAAVSDSAEAFNSFGDFIMVNSTDQVLFTATVDPPGHPDRDDYPTVRAEGRPESPEKIEPPMRRTRDGLARKLHEGVFLDSFDNLQSLGDTEEDFVDLEPGIDFNRQGMAVFRAWSRSGPLGILRSSVAGNGQAVVKTGPIYRTLGPPSLNDRQEIAFYAATNEGVPMVMLARSGSGQPGPVLETSDGFSAFQPGVAISPTGDIACVAKSRVGHVALVVVKSPAPTRKREFQVLLSTENSLTDKAGEAAAIESIAMGPRAFFSSNHVVVRVGLKGGGQRILRVATR